MRVGARCAIAKLHFCSRVVAAHHWTRTAGRQLPHQGDLLRQGSGGSPPREQGLSYHKTFVEMKSVVSEEELAAVEEQEDFRSLGRRRPPMQFDDWQRGVAKVCPLYQGCDRTVLLTGREDYTQLLSALLDEVMVEARGPDWKAQVAPKPKAKAKHLGAELSRAGGQVARGGDAPGARRRGGSGPGAVATAAGGGTARSAHSKEKKVVTPCLLGDFCVGRSLLGAPRCV